MLDINELQKQAEDAIANACDVAMLEAIRIDYLGKKGSLTSIMKQLMLLPVADRPKFGSLVNQTKLYVSTLIDNKKYLIEETELEKKLSYETIDVTLPGRDNKSGAMHPVSQIKQSIIDFFSSLGFDIVNGLEIETEFYNFTALNISKNHPARAMHDTFYFDNGSLLRTHTSPTQIHLMEQQQPPLRLIAPGRVYRCDSDLTHTPMFHQVEGLMIDRDVNMSHLRSILQSFLNYLFADDIVMRFRPSYFPFTEPSAEIDMACTQCANKGCRLCKFTGWIEIMGCGMVHPNVLVNVNISAQEYQGWAFGMGIDRIAMLYFGIPDLRMLFENDVNFLKQF